LKRKILLILLPITIHTITTVLTNGNFVNNTLTFILLIYFFGYFLNSKKELLITVFGYTLLTLIINIIEGNNILKFFFMILLFFIIAISSGYYSKGKILKTTIFPLFFTLFMFYAYGDYRSFYNGINSGVTIELPNIELFNSNLEKTEFNKKDKVYVLDFWATSCGICIQKFPDFEKKVFEYKDNPNVEFYSINIPVRRENINDNITLVTKKYNYNFNKLYAKDFSPCDSLGFNKFPTLVLIKNGKIHYQGSLILDDDITIHHIDTEIKRVMEL